ncbi:hypothetical protein ASG47_19040 [Devosia sp. Leaf420]|uniref:hypothetical protein n=1 Tax=Devosia sp. Leaf420 TaxID=1736374 RepID=UPI00071396E1|nr:hypothetical protein [Devosia sp. Leaf420]KQT51263.1 hypothetical protein ASG47_19040 [Devosia sp. Leaf420]
MTASPSTPDPYAELDYRADAAELSDGFRKPMTIKRTLRGASRADFPTPRRSAFRIGRLD